MGIKLKKTTAAALKELIARSGDVNNEPYDGNPGDHQFNEGAFVACGIANEDFPNYYDASVILWDEEGEVWVDYGDVWLRDANGEKLKQDTNYICIRYGDYTITTDDVDDTRPVYETFGMPPFGCGLKLDSDGALQVDAGAICGCNLTVDPDNDCRLIVKTTSVELVTDVACVDGEIQVTKEFFDVVDNSGCEEE